MEEQEIRKWVEESFKNGDWPVVIILACIFGFDERLKELCDGGEQNDR